MWPILGRGRGREWKPCFDVDSVPQARAPIPDLMHTAHGVSRLGSYSRVTSTDPFYDCDLGGSLSLLHQLGPGTMALLPGGHKGCRAPRRLQTALRASSVCDRTPSQVSTGSIIRSKDQDPGPGVAEVMPCRQWEANVPSPDHPSNCSPVLSTPLMDLGPGGTVPHMWLWGQRQACGGGGEAVCFFFFFFIATVYTTVSHTASGTWPKPIGAGSWGSQAPLLTPPPPGLS